MKVPVSRMSAVGMFNKPVFPIEYCARITVQQKNRKNSNKYFFIGIIPRESMLRFCLSHR